MRKDTDQPVGPLVRIPDHLPSPDKLVYPSDRRKITLQLDEESYRFFTEQASRYHVPYQRMIREVLIRYARAHSKPPPPEAA